MSGGVDSSVAAYLLQQQGYAVAGLFMKNWDEDDGTAYCTAIADLADAQQLATHLIYRCIAPISPPNIGIMSLSIFYRVSSAQDSEPRYLCNREIKFRQFVDYAQTLGADYIATGHYVKRVDQPGGVIIEKGVDINKDQTYFLQAVPKSQLENAYSHWVSGTNQIANSLLIWDYKITARKTVRYLFYR